ncbi:MAG: EAL domain-containing protein, partial [Oscillospiraceae bacterium]|nr:EAL domain-containing protein [Oscillospiraceae bacterium]
VFVPLLYLSAVLVFGCLIYNFRKPRQISIEPPLRMLLFFAGAALLLNATAMLTPSLQMAYVLFGMYHIAMDFVVNGMMCFVRRYTGIRAYHPKTQTAFGLVAIADAVLMMINCFVPVVFACEQMTDQFGAPFWHISSMSALYLVHALLIYAMVSVLVWDLIRKILQSPKIYKLKYAVILILDCIVIICHTIYLQLKTKIDYSLFWYAIVAFSICYFSIIYIPRGLMDRLLYFTISNMQDGIICLDIENKCVHANRTAKIYCDFEIDQQVATWFTEEIPLDAEDYSWDARRRISGGMRYYRIQYQKIFDIQSKYLGCFFIIQDCTKETERFESEKYRATHDALTGIYNKEYFYEMTREEIAQNPSQEYCIVCTDVKNFKLVNDMFGIQTGDKLLLRIAGILRSLAGERWVYGRLTGDRFALCVPEEEFDEEQMLRKIVRMAKLTEDTVFKVHIHIGVYKIEDKQLGISMMCDRANLAIRTIKDSYQNIVAYYKENLRESKINEQKVISEFEEAIRGRQFAAYVQPQIAVNGKIRGGEVLVRWIHPERGMIPPGEFIPIFEQTGFISRLDAYMWETACMRLQRWKNAGLTENYLSINISQKDFYLLDVYKTMTGLVEYYDIDPKNLHLEITETAVMNNPQTQLPLIAKLRNYGFLVEIDDFGSGYSSLNTLKDLQADILKIDMGFLSETAHQGRSKLILQMIIALAKALRMEVITEGVETQDQVNFLKTYGCDIFQGYYFAKPMPIMEFEMQYLNRVFDL